MPGPKVFCQAVRVSHWLVVLNGKGTDSGHCRKVFAFNRLSREWTQWQATPYALCAAASTGHQLYIAGGCPPDGGKAVGFVYKLHDSHAAWNIISRLPRPCCNCAATILNSKLYVAGTQDELRYPFVTQISPVSSVQMLDLQSNTWSEITMRSYRRRFQDILGMTRLVTLGHLLITDRLTTYNVLTKESGDLPSLPATDNDEQHFGMTVVNDKLLVWKRNTRKVYILSEDHTQWSSLPDLGKDHVNGSLCTVDSRVYAVGGQHDTYRSASSFECFE